MKNNIDSIESQKTAFSQSSKNNFYKRRLIIIVWIIGIILGAVQVWEARHHMSADGMSYIDVADAYLRGDWKTAVNSYWSPLYSWLLALAMIIMKPSAYFEFTLVHIVNIFIYLFTMGSFHFFLMTLIKFNRFRMTDSARKGSIIFSERAWIALGYILFFHSSLILIGVWDEGADMLVAAFVYLASGIILRIRNGMENYSTYALLGLTLGFGYIAKAVMFPLSIVFLSVSALSMGNLKKALPRTILAFIIFLIVASPFVTALSISKGRFTFGDSGKYSYWFHVNGNNSYIWDGDPLGSGTPVHPPRKIYDKPKIYEFGTPLNATYPLWYDPSYWNEGLKPHFDMSKQLNTIKKGIKFYLNIIFSSYFVLLVGSLILYLTTRRRWMIITDILEHWNLFLPAFAALGMYTLVSVDHRYSGQFYTLIWLGIFSGIHLPDSEESKRLLRNTAIVMVLFMIALTGRHLLDTKTPSHVQWQIAEALNKMGVIAGDRVASIGHSHGSFWARLTGVRIVAEIPRTEVENFWEADSAVKAKAIKTFGKTGAKAIVTKLMPVNSTLPGWQQLAGTNYYVYIITPQN